MHVARARETGAAARSPRRTSALIRAEMLEPSAGALLDLTGPPAVWPSAQWWSTDTRAHDAPQRQVADTDSQINVIARVHLTSLPAGRPSI
jgi:hypothetical protein